MREDTSTMVTPAEGIPERGQAGRWLDSLLRRHPVVAAVLVVALMVVAAIRNGVGTHPFAEYFANVLAPMWPTLPTDVPPLFQFVLWSPIGPASAHLLRISDLGPYVALHASVFVLGLAAISFVAIRRFGPRVATILVLVVVLSPATTVVLTWTGGYDVFTVILSLTLVIGLSDRWSFVVGALLAVTALEHGALILCSLLLLAMTGVWGRPRSYVIAGIGSVVSGVVLVLWLRSFDVDHGRAYWIEHYGFSYFLRMVIDSWLLLLVSLFGVLWPVVFVLLRGRTLRELSAPLIVMFMPFIPMAVTEDQTRVFAILTIAPLVALVLSRTMSGDRAVERSLWLSLSLAWLPGFFVWQGTPHLADWGPWTMLFS